MTQIEIISDRSFFFFPLTVSEIDFDLKVDQIQVLNVQAQELKESLLFCSAAKIKISQKEATQNVISITDASFYVYKGQKGRKELKCTHSISWILLEQIRYSDEKWITLQFLTDTISFTCPRIRNALDTLGYHFNGFFTHYFISKFPFLLKYQTEVHRPCTIARFVSQCKRLKQNPQPSILSLIERQIDSLPTDLSNCPTLGKCAPAFLDIYNLYPYIKTLLIPEHQTTGIQGFFLTNSTLEEVTFTGKVPSNIKEIVSAIGRNPRTKIKKISFFNCEITSSTLRVLSPYKHIRIIQPPRKTNFAIFSEKQFEQLYISDAFIQSPFPLKGVTHLSLVNCSIDISQFLPLLPENLISLDFSGNKSTTQLKSVKLPPTLVSLKLDNVEFQNSETLVAILKSFFSHKITELSLSNTDVPFDSLLIFERCDTSKLTLFHFDSNPLDESVCTFISHATNLEDFSINGCPLELGITQYLRKLYHLKKFSMRGSDSFKLRSNTHNVLTSLMDIRGLEYLDVSDQEFNEDALMDVAYLALNTHLEEIHLDGSNVTDEYWWKALLLRLEQRSTPLHIPFPRKTLGNQEVLKNRFFELNFNHKPTVSKVMLDFSVLDDALDDEEDELSERFDLSSSSYSEIELHSIKFNKETDDPPLVFNPEMEVNKPTSISTELVLPTEEQKQKLRSVLTVPKLPIIRPLANQPVSLPPLPYDTTSLSPMGEASLTNHGIQITVGAKRKHVIVHRIKKKKAGSFNLEGVQHLKAKDDDSLPRIVLPVVDEEKISKRERRHTTKKRSRRRSAFTTMEEMQDSASSNLSPDQSNNQIYQEEEQAQSSVIAPEDEQKMPSTEEKNEKDSSPEADQDIHSPLKELSQEIDDDQSQDESKVLSEKEQKEFSLDIVDQSHDESKADQGSLSPLKELSKEIDDDQSHDESKVLSEKEQKEFYKEIDDDQSQDESKVLSEKDSSPEADQSTISPGKDNGRISSAEQEASHKEQMKEDDQIQNLGSFSSSSSPKKKEEEEVVQILEMGSFSSSSSSEEEKEQIPERKTAVSEDLFLSVGKRDIINATFESSSESEVKPQPKEEPPPENKFDSSSDDEFNDGGLFIMKKHVVSRDIILVDDEEEEQQNSSNIEPKEENQQNSNESPQQNPICEGIHTDNNLTQVGNQQNANESPQQNLLNEGIHNSVQKENQQNLSNTEPKKENKQNGRDNPEKEKHRRRRRSTKEREEKKSTQQNSSNIEPKEENQQNSNESPQQNSSNEGIHNSVQKENQQNSNESPQQNPVCEEIHANNNLTQVENQQNSNGSPQQNSSKIDSKVENQQNSPDKEKHRRRRRSTKDKENDEERKRRKSLAVRPKEELTPKKRHHRHSLSSDDEQSPDKRKHHHDGSPHKKHHHKKDHSVFAPLQDTGNNETAAMDSSLLANAAEQITPEQAQNEPSLDHAKSLETNDQPKSTDAKLSKKEELDSLDHAKSLETAPLNGQLSKKEKVDSLDHANSQETNDQPKSTDAKLSKKEEPDSLEKAKSLETAPLNVHQSLSLNGQPNEKEEVDSLEKSNQTEQAQNESSLDQAKSLETNDQPKSTDDKLSKKEEVDSLEKAKSLETAPLNGQPNEKEEVEKTKTNQTEQAQNESSLEKAKSQETINLAENSFEENSKSDSSQKSTENKIRVKSDDLPPVFKKEPKKAQTPTPKSKTGWNDSSDSEKGPIRLPPSPLPKRRVSIAPSVEIKPSERRRKSTPASWIQKEEEEILPPSKIERIPLPVFTAPKEDGWEAIPETIDTDHVVDETLDAVSSLLTIDEKKIQKIDFDFPDTIGVIPQNGARKCKDVENQFQIKGLLKDLQRIIRIM